MKNVTATFRINPALNKTLQRVPDEMLKAIAIKTRDASNQLIPRDTGTMRIATKGFHGVGVVKVSNGYKIGSATDYASDVWQYPDSRTHWTTPGTGNRWFVKAWQKYGNSITKIVTNNYKLR